MVSKGVRSVQQALIKWSSWPESMATWEDLEALRQRFPSAPAWGQAGSLRGGGMLLPLLRMSPIQLGLGTHLGPSSQTSVCPGESGFGPSSGVRELAPACASRASRGWVPCLRGKREKSSACMNNKHNTLLWRNLSSVRILSLPLNPISDPLFSPVANSKFHLIKIFRNT